MIAFTPFTALFQLISLLGYNILVWVFLSFLEPTIALSSWGHSHGLDYTVYNRMDTKAKPCVCEVGLKNSPEVLMHLMKYCDINAV